MAPARKNFIVSLSSWAKKGIAAGAYGLTWFAILISILQAFLVVPPKSWAVTGGTTLTVIPSPPSGLTAIDHPADNGGAIDLSWTPSTSTGVTEQRVYKATTTGGPYSLAATITNNTTSTYTDSTGLTNGTTYYYVIRAFGGGQESGNSNEASAAPVDNLAPSAPTLLTATDVAGDGGGAINLTWTPSTSGDVMQQRVYRSTTTGGPYSLVTTFSNNTSSSYTDTGLTNGITYYYVIKAYDGTQESANSNEANAVPVNNPPFTPSGLSAADTPSDNGGAINLSWTPSASGDVTQQRVYRSTTTGGPYTLVTTFTNNTTSSYTDTGLTNGTTYYYIVRAYDGTQESANSNEASATPLDNIVPSAPTTLSAIDTPLDNGGSINLNWTPSASTDVKEQRIYRSSTIGGPYTLVATIINNTTSTYTNTGLTNGTTYYYVIRAYDGTYESASSNESSATPVDNTAPAAPATLTASDVAGDNGGAIVLSWTPSTSTDVVQQRIYRSLTTGGPYNLLTTIANNTTATYTDTGLTNGTTYYYIIRAYDGTQESSNSNQSSAAPLDNIAPAAPAALSATDVVNDSGGAINLSWTPSTSTDVTQQRIYRSTITGGPYTLIATITNNTASTYRDTGLTNGTTYYYVIRAYDGTQESSNSNQASAVVIGSPSATASTVTATSPIYSDGVSASTVTITVRDANNNPVSGATVTLSSSRGALDTITQPVGTTNSNGLIIGTVTSTSTGDAVITATVNGSVTLTQTATINFYNTQTGSNVTVSPSSDTTVTYDMVITIGITSSTQSGTGTALPASYINPVYFNISTTATFSGTVTICITYNEATYGVREGLVKILHNEGGILVDRTTSINIATNTVCGVVTSFSEFATASTTATNLQITTAPQTVTAGYVSNVVTVEAKDNNGATDQAYSGTANVSSNSTTLRLDTSPAGAFLGSTLSISITNGVGNFYFKDTTKGTPTITVADAAAVLTSTSQQETILADVPTGTISLTPSPISIVANGITTSTVTSGVIRDVYGNSVENGTLITVATDRGTIITADASGAYAGIQVATGNGVISFTIQSSTTVGTANVTAASVQGSASGSTQITFLPGPPAGTITLTPSPSSIVANGTTTSTVTSGVITDAYGNTVSNGTLITIATSLGTITTADADTLTAGIQVATSSGVINFVVQSGTVAGTANVTAASVQGSASGNTQITLLPGPPAGTFTLTPNPLNIPANGTSTSAVTSGTIQDFYGNTVLNGTLITVSTNKGTITTADADAGTAGIQVATSSGVITFTVRSDTTEGTAIVSATSVLGSASGQTTITFTNVAPELSYPAETGYGNGDALEPNSGIRSTVYTYKIIYRDVNNNPPTYMRICIDYPSNPCTVMSLDTVAIDQSLRDGNYSNGEQYAYTITLLNSGPHTYYFETSDGLASTKLPSVGSLSGPQVNYSPELSYSSDAGYGTDGVDPDTGNTTVTFNFKVVYKDLNNQAPTSITACVDGSCYAMSVDTGASAILQDGNYTNGEQYVYSTTLSDGAHNYYFIATDGLEGATLPLSGNLTGPLVTTTYTPAGTNVSVNAYFLVTGSSGSFDMKVTVTYETITDAESDGGDTYITYNNSGTGLPSGYLHGVPNAYFDITQQRVTYSGRVTVCVSYGASQYFGVGYGGERGSRLLHYENGAFKDRTTMLNVNDFTQEGITYGGEVCGQVLSFSEFVVAVEEATLVTLNSFRAAGMDGKILLTWSTASEVDSIGFNILRGTSPDGPFTRINDWVIRSKGTSTRGMTYTHEDIDVKDGTTYFYRLENVDINGRIAAHMIASAAPGPGTASPGEEILTGHPAPEVPAGVDIHTAVIGGEPLPAVSEPPEGSGEGENMVTETMSTDGALEIMPTIGAGSPEKRPEIPEPEALREKREAPKGFTLKIADDAGNEMEVSLPEETESVRDPFEVMASEDGKIVLKWSAKGNLKGFNVLRVEVGQGKEKDRGYVKVNVLPMPFFASQGGDKGLVYHFKDAGAGQGKMYRYKVETIFPDGTSRDSTSIEVSTIGMENAK